MILTILTPVFNGASYLEACVENVANQWAEGIEHLVLDGGSSDGSREILERLSGRYPHLRWVSEKDKGQSDAMNKGIRMAKGKWISFLNVDDYYQPGILPVILERIRGMGTEPCLLVGNLNVWDEHGRLVRVNRPTGMTLPLLLADICEWPFNPSAYFYPASVHQKVGFFPVEEHYAMDYDFILHVFQAGIPVRYYDETWGNFRLLPDAKTGRDQTENTSFSRAQAIRDKYLSLSGTGVKIQTWIWKKLWAIRNKLYGLIRPKPSHRPI